MKKKLIVLGVIIIIIITAFFFIKFVNGEENLQESTTIIKYSPTTITVENGEFVEHPVEPIEIITYYGDEN